MRYRFVAAIVLGITMLRSVNAARPVQQSDDLPEGDGKKILQASCTACHELTEITKFKGYYGRDDWRDIVKTMIEYGAKVKDTDVNVLVDYLTKNLGKK